MQMQKKQRPQCSSVFNDGTQCHFEVSFLVGGGIFCISCIAERNRKVSSQDFDNDGLIKQMQTKKVAKIDFPLNSPAKKLQSNVKLEPTIAKRRKRNVSSSKKTFCQIVI
jgi:hypothetical protein